MEDLNSSDFMMKLMLLRLKYGKVNKQENGFHQLKNPSTQARDESKDFEESSSQLQETIRQCIREASAPAETEPLQHPAKVKAASSYEDLTAFLEMSSSEQETPFKVVTRKSLPAKSSKNGMAKSSKPKPPELKNAQAGSSSKAAPSFAAAIRSNLPRPATAPNIKSTPAGPSTSPNTKPIAPTSLIPPCNMPTLKTPSSTLSVSPTYSAADLSLAILNITPLLNEKALTAYFSQYGDVGSVYISRKHSNSAFITFLRYYTNDTPLKSTTHVIEGHLCKLTRALVLDVHKQFRHEIVTKSKNLMVSGNLADIQSFSIKKYFETFGAVEDVHRNLDPATKKFKNFAFVVFKSTKAVDAAVATIDHKIDGQTVYVKRNKEYSA